MRMTGSGCFFGMVYFNKLLIKPMEKRPVTILVITIERMTVYIIFFPSTCTRSSIFTRSCRMVSRSRTVTVWSCSVWKSTVTQNGVPISSCRR